jgi:MerR family copper efflux transcriptional regulator
MHRDLHFVKAFSNNPEVGRRGLTTITMMQVNAYMKSRSGGRSMTIGELAGAFGLAPHVLRYWETMGLLRPDRQPNGRRRYQHKHVIQVSVILLGKEAGFTLDQLRELLASRHDPTIRHRLLAEQQNSLRQRTADAHASLATLARTLDCNPPELAECVELMNRVGHVHPADAPSIHESQMASPAEVQITTASPANSSNSQVSGCNCTRTQTASPRLSRVNVVGIDQEQSTSPSSTPGIAPDVVS